MVRNRENRQKHLTSRSADMGLLRTDLGLNTLRMYVGIINVLGIKETAP